MEEISVPVGMTILYHFFNTFPAHDVVNLAQVTSCFSRTNLRHVTEVVRESSKNSWNSMSFGTVSNQETSFILAASKHHISWSQPAGCIGPRVASDYVYMIVRYILTYYIYLTAYILYRHNDILFIVTWHVSTKFRIQFSEYASVWFFHVDVHVYRHVAHYI